MNINKRLLRDLFQRKKVAYHNEVYRKLYTYVFPLPLEFEAFLQATNDEVALDHAKKIIHYFNFESKCSVPSFFFENLIESENDNTARTTSSYVGKDHYVHSVYVYILGIYFFFMHKVFHSKILEQFESPSDADIALWMSPVEIVCKNFITSWKLFALLHDVGYVFENAVNAKGQVKAGKRITKEKLLQYGDLRDFFSHDLAIKLISTYILLYIVSRNSKKTLKDSLNNITRLKRKGKWACPKENGEFEFDKLTKKFESCYTYQRIEFIKTEESFGAYMPFLDHNKLVRIIRNSAGDVIEISQGVRVWNRVVVNGETIPDSAPEKDGALGTIEYYTDKLSDEITRLLQNGLKAAIPYFPHFAQDNENLGRIIEYFDRKLGNQLAGIVCKTDIDIAVFSIYAEISNEIPQGSHEDFFKRYSTQETEIAKEAVREYFNNRCVAICKDWKGITNEAKNYDYMSQSSDLLATLEFELAKNHAKKIHKLYSNKMAARPLVDSSLLHVLSLLTTVFKKTLGGGYIPLHSNAGTENMKAPAQVSCDYFAWGRCKDVGDPSKETELDLYQGVVKKLGKKLTSLNYLKENESFDLFLSYQPDHSVFDHSIVGAHLLTNCHIIHKILFSKLSQKTFCYPLYPQAGDFELVTEKCTLVEEAVFAILIHNIYVNIYKKKTGRAPMQKIQENAFSYLGAFCDSLQVWARPQQIDQSKLELSRGFYQNDVDLSIEKEIVYIKCRTKDIGSAQEKLRDDLSQFLFDADKWIRFSSISEL